MKQEIKQNPLTLEECVALAKMVPTQGWCKKINECETYYITKFHDIDILISQCKGFTITVDLGSHQNLISRYSVRTENYEEASKQKEFNMLYKTYSLIQDAYTKSRDNSNKRKFSKTEEQALADARALLRSQK